MSNRYGSSNVCAAPSRISAEAGNSAGTASKAKVYTLVAKRRSVLRLSRSRSRLGLRDACARYNAPSTAADILEALI
jgi:hypothetical protein